MSKTLCLKLREDIYDETEKILEVAGIPRNSYINSALELYNKLNRRRLLKKKLAKESALVQNESLEVLSEFEFIDDQPLFE